LLNHIGWGFGLFNKVSHVYRNAVERSRAYN
jgi:hypothetical protein